MSAKPILLDMLYNLFEEELNKDNKGKRIDASKRPTSEFLKFAQAYLDENALDRLTYEGSSVPLLILTNQVQVALSDTDKAPESIESENSIGITVESRKGRRR